MQKIGVCLWFDDQAEEAVNFYTAIFKNSKIGDLFRYGPDMPGKEGTVMTVPFELEGQSFLALNGGPIFRFTPATSLMVSCESPEEIDRLWAHLSAGGEVLMPLQKYPFSDKFGWTNDKYGLSWQLNLAGSAQKIRPALMFVGEQCGRAEEAMNFYTALFEDSTISHLHRYEAGGVDREGTVMHALFSLASQEFVAMDSGHAHQFSFTEAVSFMIDCESQAEVDHFWDNLTAGGDENAQQCGWLKDKFGVSWQVVPSIIPQLMSDPDPAKSQRVMQAILPMKKIDIGILRQAAAGQ